MRTHIQATSWLLLCCGALAGCGAQNEYQPPPTPQVTVAQPLSRPVQEYFITTGQTQARNIVELRARVDGYLKEINFEDGDLVEENQLLFVIDKEPYENAVLAAQAALDKAKSQLALADQQLARARNLAQEQATAISNLDVRVAEQAFAAADVDAAEAALAEAELNRDYTEIRAPFAGRIGRHLVDEGNLVQSEVTLLATIESVDPMHAYFALSESDLLRFRELQSSGAMRHDDTGAVPIELALGDRGEFEFRGELDFREFGIQTSTGTTMYRARFDNPDGALIPGMFVRVRMEIGEPHPLLLVEERALAADQRGEYVTIVNGDNVVEHRIVDLGVRQGDLRAIRNGLMPDDWVVVNGLQRARPGVEVDPQRATMGSDDGGTEDTGDENVAAAANLTDDVPTEPVSIQPSAEDAMDDGHVDDANETTDSPEIITRE